MRTISIVSVAAVLTAILANGVWIGIRQNSRGRDPAVAPRASVRLDLKVAPQASVTPVKRNPGPKEQVLPPATQPLPVTRIGEIPDDLLAKRLTIPVPGIRARDLHPDFYNARGERGHEAIDIMAPRGQPVIAVEDGKIAKLFTSERGGLTIYQFDPTEKYAYYYAHLDRYADGLAEADKVVRGQIIGYVGSTGNADALAPHLHFAIFLLGPDKTWWKGEALGPYPALTRR